jgi:hypothetical protein
MYALAAVVSAIVYLMEYRLLLWRLSGKEVEGDRIWKNLRRFSGWMCAGCVSGAVSSFLWMQWRNFDYISLVQSIRDVAFYEFQAISNQYYVAFFIFYPFHLLCLIFAMNMLLRRVSDHASHSYYNTARDQEAGRFTHDGRFDWRDCVGQYALYYLVRSINKVAMLLCALHVVVRVVGAGFRAELAQRYFEAAAATSLEGRDTSASREIYASILSNNFRANVWVTISRVLEAVVFVLEASAFSLFFPACIVMFRRVERRLHTIMQEMSLRSDIGNAFLPFEFSPPAAEGSQAQVEMPIVEVRAFLKGMKSSAAAQRRRFIFCLAFVLITLVALASHAVFVAVSAFRVPRSCPTVSDLSEAFCGMCQDESFIIAEWYLRTPEFSPLVLSLCMPLPLMFALWLMTTPGDRALLVNPSRFRTDVVAQQPVETESETRLRLRAEAIRMGIVLCEAN